MSKKSNLAVRQANRGASASTSVPAVRRAANAPSNNDDPNTPAEIDFVGGGMSPSSPFGVRILQSGGDISALRTLAVLRDREWQLYDRAVVQIARGRYTIVKDLLASGLRMKLTNPLAMMSVMWERIGDMDDAQIDMTGEAADIRDRLEFAQDSVPIPIIHKGFRVNIRHLLASRNYGQGIDVTHAEAATIKVVEMTEKLVISGNFSAGSLGGRVYGVTTYPYRLTGALAAAWTSATAAQIFNDVNTMVAQLEGVNMYGPYGLYIPRAYAQVLRKDYDTTTATGRSILDRLMQIEGLKFIKTNQFLTGNNVVMVQLTKDVIEMIDGFQPRVVEWNTNGGMTSLFKVMSIMVPRIKRDALDQVGIAHYSI